jgi:hypothetical protein
MLQGADFTTITGTVHRYLMSRLCLQVFYLWRHVSSTAPPLILVLNKLNKLFENFGCCCILWKRPIDILWLDWAYKSYMWRHVSSTAPPFILWWSNLKLLFGPLRRSSPFIGELRCQAIQMEHGPYIQREPKKQSILWVVYVITMP